MFKVEGRWIGKSLPATQKKLLRAWLFSAPEPCRRPILLFLWWPYAGTMPSSAHSCIFPCG
jgi:hypothetical protein